MDITRLRRVFSIKVIGCFLHALEAVKRMSTKHRGPVGAPQLRLHRYPCQRWRPEPGGRVKEFIPMKHGGRVGGKFERDPVVALGLGVVFDRDTPLAVATRSLHIRKD
jgi:hypothetical protein